jgi:hypothetical protein
MPYWGGAKFSGKIGEKMLHDSPPGTAFEGERGAALIPGSCLLQNQAVSFKGSRSGCFTPQA